MDVCKCHTTKMSSNLNIKKIVLSQDEKYLEILTDSIYDIEKVKILATYEKQFVVVTYSEALNIVDFFTPDEYSNEALIVTDLPIPDLGDVIISLMYNDITQDRHVMQANVIPKL